MVDKDDDNDDGDEEEPSAVHILLELEDLSKSLLLLQCHTPRRYRRLFPYRFVIALYLFTLHPAPCTLHIYNYLDIPYPPL
jgi:hypothetical protein